MGVISLIKNGENKMKTFVGALITILLLTAFSGIGISQPMQEEEQQFMHMPMMQSMMGGRGGMMQGNFTGQMPMIWNMMYPMYGHMMGGGMMNQMPMMGRGMMGGAGRMAYFAYLADELGLSETQQSKINDVFTSHQIDMIKKNSNRQMAVMELYKLISRDEPDLDTIKEQIEKVADLEVDMRYSQIKVWMDAKDVLTEEQQKELKNLINQRYSQMGGQRQSVRPGYQQRQRMHQR